MSRRISGGRERSGEELMHVESVEVGEVSPAADVAGCCGNICILRAEKCTSTVRNPLGMN